VLFASNFPLDDTRAAVRAFLELPLTSAEFEQVANANFRRFLGTRLPAALSSRVPA
jgi:hypothetical protein